MALAIQPAYIEALSVNSFGNKPFSTTSEIQKWPPCFNTRYISLNILSFSGNKFKTQLLTTTSIELSGRGIFSISPSINSTLVYLRLVAFFRAFSIICGEKSMPITLPVSPTSALAIKQSLPAPEPKSKMVLPSLIPAYSVGNPQPTPKSASASYPLSPL